MKILMIAHTSDENGLHSPEEIIDLSEATALDYINRGLALPLKEEELQKEEATGKGQQAGRHAVVPEKKDK